MSHVDEAIKILETPEAEGGLSDSEKILAASNVLRSYVEVPAPVVSVESVVTPTVEAVVPASVVAEVPPAPTV